METLKEERPLVVVKRLRNRNIFIMERSQEDGPAAKRCRMENRDGQQIIQEKQRTIENLKELQASKLNLQAQITTCLKCSWFKEKVPSVWEHLNESIQVS